MCVCIALSVVSLLKGFQLESSEFPIRRTLAVAVRSDLLLVFHLPAEFLFSSFRIVQILSNEYLKPILFEVLLVKKSAESGAELECIICCSRAPSFLRWALFAFPKQ